MDLAQTNSLLALFKSNDDSSRQLAWELFDNAETFPPAAENPPLYDFLTHYSLYHQLIANKDWKFIRAAQQLYLRFGVEYLQHLGNRDWETTQHGLSWEQKEDIYRNAHYIKKLTISTSEDSLMGFKLQRFLSLKKLTITGKSLCHLPAGLRFLTNLEELVLADNKICAEHFSPYTTKNWQHLKRIDLSHNRFQQFPPALFSLKRLEYINLSHCWFWGAKIPPNLKQLLPRLELLDLRNNLNLKTIPAINGVKILI